MPVLIKDPIVRIDSFVLDSQAHMYTHIFLFCMQDLGSAVGVGS